MSNNNFVQSLFTFSIASCPEFSQQIQKVEIPEIVLNAIQISTNKDKDIWQAGDKISFGEIPVSFILDAELKSWKEIRKWVLLNSSTKTYYSDATLQLLTNNKNPYLKIDFYDMFPLNCPGFPLDNSVNDNEPIILTVNFKFNDFALKDLHGDIVDDTELIFKDIVVG